MSKTAFVRWCEAHDLDASLVDARLEGYPFPHEWRTNDLIAHVNGSSDVTHLDMMFECEALGRSRPEVLEVLNERINELR